MDSTYLLFSLPALILTIAAQIYVKTIFNKYSKISSGGNKTGLDVAEEIKKGENFTVTIDKIEIYEISGQETVTPVYTTDFSSADETAVTVSAGDGAEAAVNLSNEVAAINITSYPTEGGIWSVKGDIALPGIVIENGKKYSNSLRENFLDMKSQ